VDEIFRLHEGLDEFGGDVVRHRLSYLICELKTMSSACMVSA
jgi:hypothetical protein